MLAAIIEVRPCGRCRPGFPSQPLCLGMWSIPGVLQLCRGLVDCDAPASTTGICTVWFLPLLNTGCTCLVDPWSMTNFASTAPVVGSTGTPPGANTSSVSSGVWPVWQLWFLRMEPVGVVPASAAARLTRWSTRSSVHSQSTSTSIAHPQPPTYTTSYSPIVGKLRERQREQQSEGTDRRETARYQSLQTA